MCRLPYRRRRRRPRRRRPSAGAAGGDHSPGTPLPAGSLACPDTPCLTFREKKRDRVPQHILRLQPGWFSAMLLQCWIAIQWVGHPDWKITFGLSVAWWVHGVRHCGQACFRWNHSEWQPPQWEWPQGSVIGLESTPMQMQQEKAVTVSSVRTTCGNIAGWFSTTLCESLRRRSEAPGWKTHRQRRQAAVIRDWFVFLRLHFHLNRRSPSRAATAAASIGVASSATAWSGRPIAAYPPGRDCSQQ